MPPAKRTAKPRAATEPERPQSAPLFEPEAEPEAEGIEAVAARVREVDAELTPPRRAARERRDREVLEVAAATTVDTAVRAIATVRVDIDQALESVSGGLVEQAKKLTMLDEAVAVKRRQLAELHDIEVVADTLAALLARWEQSRAAMAAEAATMRADIEREVAERRGALEAERARWREDFEAEKVRSRTAWEREQEELVYATKTKRTREEEEYQGRKRAAQAAMAEEKARHEQGIAEREQAMAAREQELADLRARVAVFEAELAVATGRAVDQAVKAADERSGHEAALKARDAAATEKLLQQRIAALEQTVKEQAERIDELQKELKDATARVRDIAVKAIEGASGATALTRVTDIAMQQARGTREP